MHDTRSGSCLFPTPRHYIGGSWIEISHGPVIERFDPATGQQVECLPIGTRADVDSAVAAASKAFDTWGSSTVEARVELLERILVVVSRRREQFAQLISSEIGAPIDFARTQQVGTAVRHLEDTIEAARPMSIDQPIAPELPGDRIRYEPIGIAALITPWNWPLNQIVLKVASALAAGCTLVIKPSEMSSQTALLFGVCIDEAGSPDGVVNVVIGDGPGTGGYLCDHPDIGVVSFTGSTAVGRSVSRTAAGGIKRVLVELGGKSPNLVFADCDLATAVRQGVAHCFRNAGQSCNAASRMLVQREVYERAIALAVNEAVATGAGLPSTQGAHMGPLVSQRQFDRVQGYIGSGITEGAKLVAGGLGRPAAFPRGYYCHPTVFADVTPTMTIFQEEIFGPVLTITPFDTEDEAISLANATQYGLAAFIQTSDAARASRVAKRLQAGTIQINGATRAPGAPFGGVKQSGISREAGIWGIRSFQEIKSISGIF